MYFTKEKFMAEKLPISKKLAKRKYRPASKFIAFIYKTIMVDIVGRKYKAKFHIIDDVNDCDGPCFVIFNHLSRIDHMYVCGATYPRVTNMLAGYCEFYRKKFSFIFGLNKVIPKKNYYPDTISIKGVAQVIKKGSCSAGTAAFFAYYARTARPKSVRTSWPWATAAWPPRNTQEMPSGGRTG